MAVDEKLVMVIIRDEAPIFRNAHDKVVFVIHATFLASGFQLYATGSSAFEDDSELYFSYTTDEVHIENWNEMDNYYGFVYFHPENSKKLLVRCSASDDNLFVDFRYNHFEINVMDYVVDGVEHNYDTMFKDFDKLVRCMDTRIRSTYDSPSFPHKESFIVPGIGGAGVGRDQRMPVYLCHTSTHFLDARLYRLAHILILLILLILIAFLMSLTFLPNYFVSDPGWAGFETRPDS